ncbi:MULTISPECIES: hypothetical protein [Anaerolinea]|uniref:hypothetical protein n=1 Tax=Anaerolinea TaxID=233189 RepID=UPI0026110927|nr:hypothetical protein [Anaerolinea thermophila]
MASMGVITALLLTATLVCVVLVAGLSRVRVLVWAVLGAVVPLLPMAYLLNRFIRAPFFDYLGTQANLPPFLGADLPWWFLGLWWLFPPLLEEWVKALVLLFPPARQLLQEKRSAFLAGVLAGLAFALGETAYVHWATPDPSVVILAGYAAERVAFTLLHAALTARVAVGLAQGGGQALRVFLGAAGLHALAVLGIVLMQIGWLEPLAALIALWVGALIAAGWSAWLARRLFRETV